MALFVGLLGALHGAGNCCTDDEAPARLGDQSLDIPVLPVEAVPVAYRLLNRLDAILESRIKAVQPLRLWAEQTKRQINELSTFLAQRNLTEAEARRIQLEHSTVRLAEIRENWEPELGAEGGGPTKRENYVPTPIVLEELQLSLERWILLWKQTVIALEGNAYPLAKLFSKGLGDIQRLEERTQAAQSFFLGEKQTLARGRFVGELWSLHLDTTAFLGDLESCRKIVGQPNRRVAALISTIPIWMLASLSDRANATLAKLDESALNDDQRRFLAVPSVAAWKEELQTWASDTVSPQELLAVVDAYEATAGASDMARLHHVATRLTVSRSPTFRQLGRLTAELYGGPNIRIYISRIFLNRLLPVNEVEEGPFREVIQGQPVFGHRRIEKEVELNLIPANDQLLLSLDVKGTVQTASKSGAFATTLFNSGYADYTAQKKIELTENGFRLLPSQVTVTNNRVFLRNIRTELDGIPILSGIVREIVLGQYESRQGGARAETSRKIAQQTRNRVDSETEERFGEFNNQFRSGMLDTLRQLGLSIEQQSAKTESDWLLGSWRMVGDGVLSGSTPAPTTQQGAFVDLKVHESAVNTLIGKLDIGGRRMSAGEFRKEIAAKFLKPEFIDNEIDDEDEDVEIAFAPENPVVVRFADGLAEIVVSIESLKLQRQTFRDFKGIVSYRPVETPDGKLFLERDGIVSFANVRAQLRTQVVLRAVFGKMFPVGRPLTLSPKFFDTDPRFADMKTGLCQIEKGWLSIALVAKE